MGEGIRLPHICPKCGKEANSMKELLSLFGLRTMNGVQIKSQSYCKKCRKQKRK